MKNFGTLIVKAKGAKVLKLMASAPVLAPHPGNIWMVNGRCIVHNTRVFFFHNSLLNKYLRNYQMKCMLKESSILFWNVLFGRKNILNTNSNATFSEFEQVCVR